MRKCLIIVLTALFMSGILFADQALFNADDIQPMKNYGVIQTRASDTVLISADANWRGIFQPGRNIIVHGDTVSVIYSQTTSNPNDFQRFYQAYSIDGGATWTTAQVGLSDCMRTYPHQAQIFDYSITGNTPYAATPYAFWLERHYPGGTGEVYFTYDELPAYQLFTPVQVLGVTGYFPTGCVWGTGNNIFETAADVGTDDIYGMTSADGGATWDSTTLVSSGSASGQVAAMVDRGLDGYGMLYFGRQEAPGRPIYPNYMETVDYGATWTAHQPLMYVEIVDSMANYDTLSLTWQGYSMVIDPGSDIPYIAPKLDYGKDPSTSYNFGEIWFTKPNGGTPGAYTFDVNNPIAIVEGTPGEFEHLAGYPTIGYYQDSLGHPMLYVFFTAFIDSNSTTYGALWAGVSQDEGNTWDVNLVSPFLDTAFAWYAPSSSYYVDDAGYAHVVMIKEGSHTDNQHLHMYHIKFNVETDLGMPSAGPYVGVEEDPVGNTHPNVFDIIATNNGRQCSFNLSVPASGITSLKIYDATGREVVELVNRHLSAGRYDFNWSAEATGTYIYRMTSDGFSQSGKISIVE